jgi:hypothetical protein
MPGTLRFGKHSRKTDFRTLRFKNYVTKALAPPPASADILGEVLKNVNAKPGDVPTLFPMDGNDTYGDCTIAAVAHAITMYDGLANAHPVVMSTKSVEKVYFKLTGGQDTGLNELDVLNHWQSNMVAREKILAFASIDPKNHDHIKQAMNLFGGVYLGFQVQQACLDDFNANPRRAWTPGPLTNEGHAVYAVGYDDKTVTVLTWGDTQQGTWDWWDECVDEAYAILPPDAKKWDGFNIDQLKADLDDVAN